MAVTDPIMLVDTDYNVLLHNGRLPAEMQSFWDQALGRKCFAKLHGRTEPCQECPIQEVQRSGQPVYQRWQTESGLVLDLSYYPVLNENKQLSAVTIILKDVTEKIKMEGRLVQSAKLAALGEMAAGVAHELNSPMTVIIGTAQLLARELLEAGQPERAEELDDIVNSGLRCKRIIQNLLTFSRQDQQPATEIDLNAEARLVLGMIKYQINRSQITITERLTADLPRLTANGPQIQQVLTNFLINARDALAEVERQDEDDRSRDGAADEKRAAVGGVERHRQRHRHSAGKSGQDLYAVLHQQGSHQGDRTRSLGQPGDRRIPQRHHRSNQHAGAGEHLLPGAAD